ncbi:F-box domain [Arabidopsis suecica]|uniref:F-box domain n=1 Tax=Arabidopsis suecica TaxID=45249 RepID=A0A8T1YLQ9_ARASU|nr:F-box domain [Arabidopsis suecica]
MDQSKKNSNRLSVIPNKWSELCQDLLRSVFERLSFTNLTRAKSVCRSWNFASRDCLPNLIPWLILFPLEEEVINSDNNSCLLFVPDDKDKIYKTRDLGVDFAHSLCLATYGSWLLMFDHLRKPYILNPLTLERIDLPQSLFIHHYMSKQDGRCNRSACLWIDDVTKDYLVVWFIYNIIVFTKKGYDTWRLVQTSEIRMYDQIVYNHKDHKVYTYVPYGHVYVWDFSGDGPPKDGYHLPVSFVDREIEKGDRFYREKYLNYKIQIATTLSGEVVLVEIMHRLTSWQFRINELNPLTKRWVKIDTLGDEALILDMGFTIVAKDIPGIKKNSIYFSGLNHPIKDPKHIFVYDLTTHTMEPVPECVFSSMFFSDARWLVPGFN